MEDNNKYIRFDWAVKRMLRDKANFGVFEGLITVLLNEPVHIIEILESESNQIEGDSTYGCVVLMAINDNDDKIIVELQTIRELYYLWNLVTNNFKPFTDHISLGDKYDKVKEGREEGRKEEKRSVALKLKAMGLDANSIAKATGPSPDELASL